MADSVSGLGEEVAAVVIGIGVGGGLSVRVGLHCLCDLAVFVVGVGLLAAGFIFDAGDVAPCVVGVGIFGHGGAGAAELVGVGAYQIGSRLSGLSVHGELGGLVLEGDVELFGVGGTGFWHVYSLWSDCLFTIVA